MTPRKYFGTDGIRGLVGQWPISADFMLKLGRAVGSVLARGGTKRPNVLIGKDTRISGYMFEAALEAGAEDFRREDEENYVVTTDPASFHAVKQALEDTGIVPSESELQMVPKTTVTVSGSDVESLLKLIESLEDLDDVQKVWANFDIDDADLATL